MFNSVPLPLTPLVVPESIAQSSERLRGGDAAWLCQLQAQACWMMLDVKSEGTTALGNPVQGAPPPSLRVLRQSSLVRSSHHCSNSELACSLKDLFIWFRTEVFNKQNVLDLELNALAQVKFYQ